MQAEFKSKNSFAIAVTLSWLRFRFMHAHIWQMIRP